MAIDELRAERAHAWRKVYQNFPRWSKRQRLLHVPYTADLATLARIDYTSVAFSPPLQAGSRLATAAGTPGGRDTREGRTVRQITLGILIILAMGSALAKTPTGFLTSWSAAQKAAQTDQKLLYLHFTTDWCSWCRRIEADTYPDPRVHKALKDYVAVSLDCTEGSKNTPAAQVATNHALFTRLGGEGYPFLVILAADGETVFRTISGYVTPETFLGELAAAQTCRKEYLAFQDYAKTADQQSYDYAVRAMTMAERLHQDTQAATMARRVLELDPTNTKGQGAQASWLALQQLPADRWKAEGLPFLDNLKRFDATNELGLREQAGWAYAYSAYTRKEYQQCIETLTDLAQVGKLRNAQNTFGLLGFAQAEHGAKEQAITTLEKAIAFDPTGRLGQMLARKLAAVKAEKAGK
jgi:thioredoxin-related protein